MAKTHGTRPGRNDLDEEIQGHLAISIKERIDRGDSIKTLLARDAGREQDEEGGPLVAVVAEAVRTALVHEGVVARAERVPRPRVVDGQLPGTRT